MKNKITIYTDQYSYFCEKTREWLQKHHFEYEEKDVKLPQNTEELFKISEQYAVPVIIADDKVILGYNEEKLKEILLD